MPVYDKAKNERISVYVDCILGMISASIGIIGIIIFAVPLWNANSTSFLLSLLFWSFWLVLCIYFIALGISNHIATKNYDPDKQSKKKNLKAPIAS